MTVISPLTLTCVSRLQVKFVNVVLRINKAEVAATFLYYLDLFCLVISYTQGNTTQQFRPVMSTSVIAGQTYS